MTLHRAVLVVVISLLNLQSSLQQSKPPPLTDITCGHKKEFQTADCAAAYRKIIYDADATLDQTESSVERTSGRCVTRVDNPKFMNVPKAIIENAFDQIVAKCNGHAGNATLPGYGGVRLMTRRHTQPSTSSFEDDTELGRVICSTDPKQVKIVKEDCMEAYRLIPTNAQGRFISVDHHEPMNSISSFVKKCVASVWTSDGSKVIALKADMDILFHKVMQECSPRWGYVRTTGALGKNGKVNLMIWGRR